MSRLLRMPHAISRISFPLLATMVFVGCGGDDNKATAAATSETQVTINELQSRNSKIESDTGKKSDWVELFNPSNTDQDLAGYFISDDSNEPKKGKLTINAVVPAEGFLVLWLDDTNDASTPLHFPFKLSGDGDFFFLSDPTGKAVRSVTIPPDPTGDNTNAPDVSYGSLPDGSNIYAWCSTPTPGQPNAANCIAADAGL